MMSYLIKADFTESINIVSQIALPILVILTLISSFQFLSKDTEKSNSLLAEIFNLKKMWSTYLMWNKEPAQIKCLLN